jgi:prepilin-type N-terminal cleavage/methylation domain-containing protein
MRIYASILPRPPGGSGSAGPAGSPVAGGFTLAEMVVVLALLAILLAVGVGSVVGVVGGGERELRRPALEVISMVREAGRLAREEDRAWAVEIGARGARLVRAEGGVERRRVLWAEGVRASVRRWGERGWRELRDDEVSLWPRRPGALVAPDALRLEDGDGRYIELELDVLTGDIGKEAWSF